MPKLTTLESICLSICAYPFMSQRESLRIAYLIRHNSEDKTRGSNGSYWFGSRKFNHLWTDLCNRKVTHPSGGKRNYISKLVLTKKGWEVMNLARLKIGASTIPYYLQQEN